MSEQITAEETSTFEPSNMRGASDAQHQHGLHAPWVPILAALVALVAFSTLTDWLCLLVLGVASAAVLYSLLGKRTAPVAGAGDQHSWDGPASRRRDSG
ncbi:MAG TPA: hypothetical protein VG433_09425 [Pirellulales bacterium]|nr:hypothetical protein [Pirellulales bacterium]